MFKCIVLILLYVLCPFSKAGMHLHGFLKFKGNRDNRKKDGVLQLQRWRVKHKSTSNKSQNN